MKPLHFLWASALLLLATLLPTTASAQINININPPSWGPPAPPTAQYYYIPDIDGYYDLRTQRYIMFRNGAWVRAASLDGYDPHSFHPVVVNYVGATPWVLVREHRVKYPKVKVIRVVQPAPRVVRVVKPMPTRVIYRERVTNLPPGQAKKIYGKEHGKEHGEGKGKGHGKGH